MKNNYTILSKYYDLLYPRDYRSESKFAISHLGKKEGSILDVGCGTGWHAYHFLKNKRFDVFCLDNNLSMIKLAKKNAKGASFVEKDFRKINYNNYFDLIIFLYGTVSYHKNQKDLEQTFSKFYSALKQNGCFIFNVGFIKYFWKSPGSSHRIININNNKLISISEFILKRNKLTKQNYYLFFNRKGNKSLEQTSHQFTLFSIGEFEKVLQKVGFKYRIYKNFSNEKWRNKSPNGSLATFVCYK